MAGARLREVCEGLGFDNVQPIIASGNLVFESERSDMRAIEENLERGWSEQPRNYPNDFVLQIYSRWQVLIGVCDEDWVRQIGRFYPLPDNSD